MKNNNIIKENEIIIRCNYINCIAGLGLAGRRSCFLNGDCENPNCKDFVEEK